MQCINGGRRKRLDFVFPSVLRHGGGFLLAFATSSVTIEKQGRFISSAVFYAAVLVVTVANPEMVFSTDTLSEYLGDDSTESGNGLFY